MNVKNAMLGVVVGVVAAGFAPSSSAKPTEGFGEKKPISGPLTECDYPITDPRFWTCNPR